MRKFFFVLTLALLWAATAVAGLTFPQLTGRVVDDAHVLLPETIDRLDHILADYENGTATQVVVVTLPSLQGDSIEDYGVQLGRHWGIGQKGKNNGVLLIVAPHDRKVRIEVGYGLEATLTDATSSAIIQGIIIPKFASGQLDQGVVDGTQAVIGTLGGKSLPVTYNSVTQHSGSLGGLITFLIIMLFISRIFVGVFPGFFQRYPWLAFLLLMNSMNRGGYGSSSSFGGNDESGGGFSGGGGSFGGGGASGSW